MSARKSEQEEDLLEPIAGPSGWKPTPPPSLPDPEKYVVYVISENNEAACKEVASSRTPTPPLPVLEKEEVVVVSEIIDILPEEEKAGPSRMSTPPLPIQEQQVVVDIHRVSTEEDYLKSSKNEMVPNYSIEAGPSRLPSPPMPVLEKQEVIVVSEIVEISTKENTPILPKKRRISESKPTQKSAGPSAGSKTPKYVACPEKRLELVVAVINGVLSGMNNVDLVRKYMVNITKKWNAWDCNYHIQKTMLVFVSALQFGSTEKAKIVVEKNLSQIPGAAWFTKLARAVINVIEKNPIDKIHVQKGG